MKISALPEGNAALLTDRWPVVRGGSNAKVGPPTADHITIPANSATGQTARLLAEFAADFVSVKALGAVGDGTSHPVSEWLVGGARDRGYANLAAIQVDYPHVGASTNEIDWAAAQKGIDVLSAAGGGCIYFPAVRVAAGQYYRLNGMPLLLRDYVTIKGDGPNSLIRNVLATSVTFMDQGVILPGNYHPEFLNSLTYASASNVTVGDMILTLASTTGYTVGMTIVARTNDFTPASVTDISAWVRFYRVTALTGTTLTLDSPVDETRTGINVARTNGLFDWRNITGHTRQKCYVCYRGRVEQIAIQSDRFWIGDSAALETSFENVTIKAEVGAYCNGLQRCSWKGVRGSVNRIVTELSMNSYSTSISDLIMDYVGDNSQNYQLMGIQERAKSVIISDFKINAPNWTRSASALRVTGNSNAIRNGTIAIAGTGAAISLDNASDTNDDNVIENVTVQHTAALTVIAQISPTGTGTASRNRLQNIKGMGTGQAGAWTAYKIGGTSNVLRGCSAQDLNAGIQLVTGALDNIIESNDVPTDMTFSDAALLPRKNYLLNNVSTRSKQFRSIRYKQAGGLTDITTTTVNAAAISFTVVAATLLAGERIEFDFWGSTGGTTIDDGLDTVAKELRITFGGVTFGTLSMSSAEFGAWRLQGVLEVRSTTTVFGWTQATKSGTTVQTAYSSASFGFVGGSTVFEFRAWLGAAGHIYVRDGLIDPIKPGYST